jgi:hypothetical protein
MQGLLSEFARLIRENAWREKAGLSVTISNEKGSFRFSGVAIE